MSATKQKKRFYLMTLNEDHQDEHRVPALAIFTADELAEFKASKPEIYAMLGNSGDGFMEDYKSYKGKDLIKCGVVSAKLVSEEFAKEFKKHHLSDLSLCSIFHKEYQSDDEDDYTELDDPDYAEDYNDE